METASQKVAVGRQRQKATLGRSRLELLQADADRACHQDAQPRERR